MDNVLRLHQAGIGVGDYVEELGGTLGRELLRPTRIEDVWEIAGRGDVMPQKSTFFYPKLTSGLLFYAL